MNKIWNLSLANIRKSKGASISLSLTIFVAAILLNLGVLTSINFRNSFIKKAEELNSAHAVCVIPKQSYQEQMGDYFKNYPGVIETEKEDAILLWQASFEYGSAEFTNPCLFLNADAVRDISVLSFAGDRKSYGDNDIYVSYILHTGGEYNLGDELTFKYKDQNYVFKIAGFTQDIHLGSVNLGCIGFYLPEEGYLKFQQELKDNTTEGVILKSRLANISDSQQMITEFYRNIIPESNEEQKIPSWASSYTVARSTRTATADIGGAIIICFSLIIVLVSVLVIKFRVSTSIEDGMTDIGVLKALGYTSRQIIGSILLQFMLLAGISTLLGISASYLTVGTLSQMFSAQTGIVWEQGFDLKSSLISLILILLSVLVITPFSARRIKKLHPILALRSGIATHSFKKNICPLDRMKGSVNFVLAIKSMLTNLKQNLMIALIIAAVSFASVFGIVMYYNIVANNEAFLNMIGTEACSAAATVKPGVDAVSLCSEISAMEGVQKVINYDYANVTIQGEETQVAIVDDFTSLENNQLYEGRYPKYNNEVIISGFLADHFGKKTGDILSIGKNGDLTDYLITGLIQSSTNIGMNISMSLEGYQRIRPGYTYNSINIYLDKGKDTGLFVDELKDKFSDKLINTLNMEELADSQLSVYTFIVAIFATVILVVTALIVIMILYLIIKAMISRRRKEFGIQKAIGYTTLQIMMQISISFLPIVLFGAGVGSLIGSLYMNSLISVLFRGIGVMKVGFTIPLLWIVLMCIGISLLAYTVSMLVSFRIRKITAYALIVE